MKETRLVFIRHGHTSSNGGLEEARLSGVTDVALSELGLREVAQLTTHLVAHGERFDAICTSPLLRATATARALSAAGLGELALFEDLKEIDCGELEGARLSEVQRRVPELWALNMRQSDPDFRWPGGESYREFRARCLGVVTAIAREFAGSRVALVTHAGVISQVWGSLSQLCEARWEAFRPGNTAASELIWRADAATVVRFDDRSHLA